MKFLNRKAIRWLVVLVSLTLIFGLGVLFGQTRTWLPDQNFMLAAAPLAGSADFSSFWQTWQIINEKYVNWANGREPVDDQTKIWGAAAGLVDSLGDPYSVFLPPEDKRAFEEEISGNFGGIGIEIGVRDDVLTVIAPLEGTPAKQAGLLPGDRIVQVDNQSIAQLAVDKVIKLIRGEVGQSVTIHILRGEEIKPRVFTIVRAKIDVPVLKTEKLPEAFIIKIYNFGGNSEQKFAQAIKQFKAQGNGKLILDLRSNPGGYLSAAIDVASWFLPSGAPVVIEQRGPEIAPIIYRSKGYPLLDQSAVKIVVLVDQGSASAAEILAGALAESGRAVLVGEKTFGKGSVQELIPLRHNAALKITTAKWLTPNGVSISKNGLTPDYPLSTKDLKEPETDQALQKALELLRHGT